MKPTSPFRVLLVDRHHPAVRASFERIPVLEVRQVSTLEDAFHASAFEDTQAVVVDVEIAGSGDFAGLQRIRTAYPGLATVVLADAETESTALAAQRHGAHDYLLRHDLDAPGIAHTLRGARRIAALECQLHALDSQLQQANRRLHDILLDMARHGQPSLERSTRLVRGHDSEQAGVEHDAAARW